MTNIREEKKEKERMHLQDKLLLSTREGVRGVAAVALATPFFRFYFIKLSKKFLKKIFYVHKATPIRNS